MIAEAVDTVITLGWALLAWIALCVLVAVLALHAVIAGVWATVRGVLRAGRALCARLSAEPPVSASQSVTAPEGCSAAHVPNWATQQPISHEEAA